MDKDQMRTKRAHLEELLSKYESGQLTHLDPDERGYLERDTTPERIAQLKEDIAELDRMISQD